MGDYYTTGGDLDKSILAGVATLYCSFFAWAAVHQSSPQPFTSNVVFYMDPGVLYVDLYMTLLIVLVF